MFDFIRTKDKDKEVKKGINIVNVEKRQNKKELSEWKGVLSVYYSNYINYLPLNVTSDTVHVQPSYFESPDILIHGLNVISLSNSTFFKIYISHILYPFVFVYISTKLMQIFFYKYTKKNQILDK